MQTYTYEHKYRLAQAFAKRFKNEKRERAEKDTFWNEFFAIFGLDRYKTATTEYAVRHRKGSTKFADVFWAGRLLCEHKSAGKDLNAAYAQAMAYIEEIRRHNPQDVPRYVMVSDFARLHLYDLQENTETAFPLEDLPEQIKRKNFDFMDGIGRAIKEAEEQANIEAAAAVGSLYAAFKADGNYPEHDLKQFLIRLLFCFFADDTLIFAKDQFEDYLVNFTREDGADTGSALNRIFSVLNTPPEKRPRTMPVELQAFPYVNGKLFEETLCEFYFNAELRKLLFACARRDWAEISPEIFGSLFQSAMNQVERRELGAHYTEEANILKVIDGLFMDDLRQAFQVALKQPKAKRREAINALHRSIGRLNFLDPACGCGNFLVVAYRELRRLEDAIIGELYAEGQLLDIATMQHIHIGQFHGIEIDEYPAQIAKVAMWLTDHQCNLRTAERFGQTRPSIPLQDSAEIINANALQTEWPEADYIFGNPPFIGSSLQNKEQKADTQSICGAFKGYGVLDYVCNWYVKAARIMQAAPHIQTAFVSTNSICQGEQVEALWGNLLKQGIQIRFAHRTFQWTSAAAGKAAVHCIVVGFAADLSELQQRAAAAKYLFSYPDIKGLPEKQQVHNISPYLIDAANIIFKKQKSVFSGEAEMLKGNQPTDGGHLLLGSEEKEQLLRSEPLAEQYIRPFLGADEFINGKQRWCVWFHGVSDTRRNHDLKQMPQIAQRIAAVKTMRQASSKAATRKQADLPHLFTEIRQPESSHYLIIPSVSSETRRFIPIGYLSSEIIISNLAFSLPNASLYHFGILCSTMHNAFMRTVAGRLKSDYRYSNTLVYNNFPFPFSRTEREAAAPNVRKHTAAIEKAAQQILDARAHYAAEARAEGLPEPSLADLYRAGAGYTRLDQAHAALDKAVDAAYGYQGKNDDAERVAFLFDSYEKAANGL